MSERAEIERLSLPSGSVAIEFEGVAKHFRSGGRLTTALAQVDLQVREGLITGLIGPDGAGKTTLLRLTAGLLVPDAGRVMVLGRDVTQESLAVQADLGYMPQRFGLYEDLTVQENLDLYGDLQGVPAGQRADRFKELMHMTALSDFTTRLAGRLSGGMKQKLGLACTLIRAPRLLLLDEPTVGVDPVSRRELWSIIDRLVEEGQITVLLTTAYLDEAERCGEVVMLHNGRVLGCGPPQDFSEQLRGRTYTVAVEALNKRRVQAALSKGKEVIDAVIQGERVRLVVATVGPPNVEALLPAGSEFSLQEAPPRFEDGFISRLHEDRADDEPRFVAAGPRSDGNGSDEVVIEVEDLKRRFGDFYAVKGVTFEVKRGEVFGLLGANGAGKTTTFRMLCGLLPLSSGRLSVAGFDLRRAPATARSRIGYMSQKFSLYGDLSVRQNLRFFSSTYGLRGRRRDQRIRWAMERFELEELAEAMSGQLPLGFKQRLSLACALMHEPEILFLDEPTSGVDPLARREFWQRINALAEQNVTVLVTTHFMEEAEYCDRLAIMSAGKILALGTPREIKARERTEAIPEPTIEQAFIQLMEKGEREP
jgi:ABC-2 type transport system ATP-binding protein